MKTNIKARFVEPMLLLRGDTLPEGADWTYELKLDGYRAIAIKTGGKVQLRSRKDNDFTDRYPLVSKALAAMPDETVLDGEIVALDENGRPSFNALQNLSPSSTTVIYYVFDAPVLAGANLMTKTLDERRRLLQTKILPKLREPIRSSPGFQEKLQNLIRAVREQNLEGLIAKRRDSLYEPGKRTGAWRKMRVNRGQEFVIGGYTPTTSSFDALIFGYYEDKRLIYVARTRNGFTQRTRRQIFERLRGLATATCPFANLPEAKSGRWGQGLTAAKMAECRWVTPSLVGQFEFVEWTPDNHLRHSRFIALRDDKEPHDVGRED